MKRSIYPNNGRFNKAAVILSSMSPDMVEDIIALLNYRGRGVMDDIFLSDNRPSNMPFLRILAPFSAAYIAEEDFEDTYLGYCSMILAELRKASWGRSDYKDVLKQAFGLPDVMADQVVAKIETYDIIKPSEGEDQSWFTTFCDQLKEGIRYSLNWGLNIAHLPWTIPQSQAYDIDMLYELKNLGVAISELNSRARLMTTQAVLHNTMGLFKTGDPETGELGDDEDACDELVGEAFIQQKALPKEIYGGLAPLAMLGSAASMARNKAILDAGGYSKEGDEIVQREPKHPGIRKSIDKILHSDKRNLAKGALKVALAGLGGVGILKLIKKMRHGDVDAIGDAYSDISTNYGSSLADAWRNGDIEALAGEIIGDASGDYTTGDSDLDEAIEQAVMENVGESLGDVEPEVGGLFTRWSINAAKKGAARRGRRQMLKSAKQGRKNVLSQQKAAAKMAKATTFADFPSADEGSDYPAPVDDSGTEDTYNLQNFEDGGSPEDLMMQ